jgi:Proto-chlorophyllide reductase 57 kD subunit
MKLDAITLDFARQVIEEETGTPLEIGAASAQSASPLPAEARLVARDEKKNPLISEFEWTEDATRRILRVPAGFMRNKTQERIEQLARERTAASIDLALVEEGIELGKKMMAEMIATYEGPTSAVARHNLNEVSPLTAQDASGDLRE